MSRYVKYKINRLARVALTKKLLNWGLVRRKLLRLKRKTKNIATGFPFFSRRAWKMRTSFSRFLRKNFRKSAWFFSSQNVDKIASRDDSAWASLSYLRVNSVFLCTFLNKKFYTQSSSLLVDETAPTKIGAKLYKSADLRPLLTKYLIGRVSRNFDFSSVCIYFLFTFFIYVLLIVCVLFFFLIFIFYFWTIFGFDLWVLVRFFILIETFDGLDLVLYPEIVVCLKSLQTFCFDVKVSFDFFKFNSYLDSSVWYFSNNYLSHIGPLLNLWFIDWESFVLITDAFTTIKLFVLACFCSYFFWFCLFSFLFLSILFFYAWSEFIFSCSDNWKLILNMFYSSDGLRFFAKTDSILQNLEGFESSYLLTDPFKFLKYSSLNSVETYYEYLFCQSVGGYIGFFDLFPSYSVVFNEPWHQSKRLLRWYRSKNLFAGRIFRSHVFKAWGTPFFRAYTYYFILTTRTLRSNRIVKELNLLLSRISYSGHYQKHENLLTNNSLFTVKFYLEVYNSLYFWALEFFSNISRQGYWLIFWERISTLKFAARLPNIQMFTEIFEYDAWTKPTPPKLERFDEEKVSLIFIHEYYRKLNELVLYRTFTKIFRRRPWKRLRMPPDWTPFIRDYSFWKKPFSYSGILEYTANSNRDFFEFDNEFSEIPPYWDAASDQIDFDEDIEDDEDYFWNGEEFEMDHGRPDTEEESYFEDAVLQSDLMAFPEWDETIEEGEDELQDFSTTQDHLAEKGLLSEDFFINPEEHYEKFIQTEKPWEMDDDELVFFDRLDRFLTNDVFYQGVGQIAGANKLTTKEDYMWPWALEFGDSINYKERIFTTIYDDLADFYWLNSGGFFYKSFFDYPTDRFLSFWARRPVRRKKFRNRRNFVDRIGPFFHHFRVYLEALVRSSHSTYLLVPQLSLAVYAIFFAIMFCLSSLFFWNIEQVTHVSYFYFLLCVSIFSSFFLILLLFFVIVLYRFRDTLICAFMNWFLGRHVPMWMYIVFSAGLRHFFTKSTYLDNNFLLKRHNLTKRSIFYWKSLDAINVEQVASDYKSVVWPLRRSPIRRFLLTHLLFNIANSRTFFLTIQGPQNLHYSIGRDLSFNFREFIYFMPPVFFTPLRLLELLLEGGGLSSIKKNDFFDLNTFPINLTGSNSLFRPKMGYGSITFANEACSTQRLLPLTLPFAATISYDFGVIETTPYSLFCEIKRQTESAFIYTKLTESFVYDSFFNDFARSQLKTKLFSNSRNYSLGGLASININDDTSTYFKSDLLIENNVTNVHRADFFFNSIVWPTLWWGKRKRRIIGLDFDFKVDSTGESSEAFALDNFSYNSIYNRRRRSAGLTRRRALRKFETSLNTMFLARARSSSYSHFWEVFFSKEALGTIYEKRTTVSNLALDENLYYLTFFIGDKSLNKNFMDQFYTSFYRRS